MGLQVNIPIVDMANNSSLDLGPHQMGVYMVFKTLDNMIIP